MIQHRHKHILHHVQPHPDGIETSDAHIKTVTEFERIGGWSLGRGPEKTRLATAAGKASDTRSKKAPDEHVEDQREGERAEEEVDEYKGKCEAKN